MNKTIHMLLILLFVSVSFGMVNYETLRSHTVALNSVDPGPIPDNPNPPPPPPPEIAPTVA